MNTALSSLLFPVYHKPYSRDQNAAHYVSCRIYKDEDECLCIPGICHRKIKHIRDAVLKAAEYEDRHSEEEGEVFSKLVL